MQVLSGISGKQTAAQIKKVNYVFSNLLFINTKQMLTRHYIC